MKVSATIMILLFLIALTSPVRGADPSPLERAFKAQILVNLNAQVAISPSSHDREEWPSNPAWKVNDKAATIFVLVKFSPALVQAAVEYWAENHPNITVEKKRAATAKLQKQYLRNGEKAFLLLVKTIEGSSYRDEWRVKIGPLADNIHLINLDGELGKVVRAEPRLDGLLDSTSSIKTCVFWVYDNIPESDPLFNIRISNIYFSIKAVPSRGKREWYQALSPKTVFFRYETGNVNILRMVEDGVPWTEIEKSFVQTELRFVTASSNANTAKFIAGVAVDLIMGLLLKAI